MASFFEHFSDDINDQIDTRTKDPYESLAYEEGQSERPKDRDRCNFLAYLSRVFIQAVWAEYRHGANDGRN